MHACSKGYASVVEVFLLADGVDVNLRDVSGNTALMIGAAAGHANVVQLLLNIVWR